MNDTKSAILNLFHKDVKLGSSEVHQQLSNTVSLVTVKRRLSELADQSYLVSSGGGRSVKYQLSKKGWLLKPVNPDTYLAKQPDERPSHPTYQFDVFEQPYVSLFDSNEMSLLEKATLKYRSNARGADATTHSKELLRFIIEFSWKSSRIEGNTYDLISTEQLLRYGQKSSTNTEYEAQMILNQKDALEFILDDLELWQRPSVAMLEEVHSLVGKNLDIPKNLRKTLVGITGTDYRPLDNEFQLKEALEQLFLWVNNTDNVYEKALLAVLGLSYVQPFVDGNKRTARLVSDAILLSHNYAPLSYRSVDERTYKEATLVFYEQNSLFPFKTLFIEQYLFAAQNYNLAREQ